MSSLGDERHRSRERALELLYESAIKDRPVSVVIDELPIQPDEFTVFIATSTEEHRAQAQQLISDNAIEWPLERIALVDRLVMEMTIAELLSPDAPPKAVVMNEAVEIARTYSGDDAPSFVNGVLAAVVDELGL